MSEQWNGTERRSRRGQQFREHYDVGLRQWRNLRRTAVVLALLLVIAVAAGLSCK